MSDNTQINITESVTIIEPGCSFSTITEAKVNL